MCTRYKICPYQHKPKWRTSKQLRNHKGQFDKNRWLASYFIVISLLIGITFLGVNTIYGGLKKLEKILIIENVQAVETIVNPTLEDEIYRVAKEYGVNGYQMYRTIECESKFKNIQSQVFKNGKQELSYGLSQIHLPSWPKVSKAEALNESFAIHFMAKHWNTATWYAYNRIKDKCN